MLHMDNKGGERPSSAPPCREREGRGTRIYPRLSERYAPNGEREGGGTMSPLGRTGIYGCVTRTRYKREKGGRRDGEEEGDILQGR